MADPNFEGLPTELKILILFQVPDTDTLKSLVFASPSYYNAYVAARPELLKNIISRQYGQIVDQAEVLTAVRSKGMYFLEKKDEAIALLDIWRRRDEVRALHQHSATRPCDSNGLEETFRLLSFYRVMDFFLEDILMNAPRPPWMTAGQWNEHLPLTLPLSEKRRFARALCRLQVMKDLFSDPVVGELFPICDPSVPEYYHNSWDLQRHEGINGERVYPMETAWRLFYGTIPPWEYDEMGSVFGYFLSRIDTIAGEISSDLRRLTKATPCEFFWDILPEEERPGGATIEIESDLVYFQRHYEGLAGLGPEFLYRVLRTDRLSRRKIICENASRNCTGTFIGPGTEASWDVRFPFTDPADNLDMSQNFKQSWSKLSAHQQPSEGWKRAWLLRDDDTLENCMDLDRAKDGDWEWCYALWDESRLREWKAPLLDKRPA